MSDIHPKTSQALKENTNHRGLSLNVYVFLLLGGFLLCLALIQLVFITLIEKQINQEISDKSIFLTTQAIDFVVSEQLDNSLINQRQSQKHLEKLRENIEQTTRKIDTEVRILNGQNSRVYRFDGTDLRDEINEQTLESLLKQQRENEEQNEQVRVLEDEKEEIETVLNQLRENLSEIRIETNKQNGFVFKTPDIAGFDSVVKFNSEQSAVKKYFTYLTIGTFAIGLLSLVFAYCLARHITSPLKSLAQGFTSLSNGKFGVSIKSKGVKEVQQTVDLFNQTSAKLAELQTIESKYQQQQHLAELGEISRGMAHSLRNPLNTIGLAIEEISQQDLNDTQREKIASNARFKIQALDSTIKSLLMLTTSGIDRSQNVSLNDVIQDVAMQMSMGSHCKIDIHAEQASSIKGSEAELTAVLHSLVSNAAEASNEDASIQIRLAQSPEKVLISVIDKGQGIASTVMDDLFKPHITTKAEGAGMGLYIAKRILSLHYNGDLTLSNNIDKGCTATITLNT
jgi:signal transduction histidine kinase